MGSEITQLRERLLLEGQAVYLGLYGYGDVAKHEVIRQRNQQMSQIIQQLDSHIGGEATDIILSEAMELAAQAYQKEQPPKAHTNLQQPYQSQANLAAVGIVPCADPRLAPLPSKKQQEDQGGSNDDA